MPDAAQDGMGEAYAMKIRIKFEKHGNIKYIGHLDLMRFFQKMFRRAELDISYSKGFNPHPVMSFASPLGVGMESVGEYLDVEMNSSLEPEEAIRVCNAASVDGVCLTEYVILPDDAKKSMALVSAADYRYVWKEDIPDADRQAFWQEKLCEYLAQDSIIVTKKTKKSEQEIDIRPAIYRMEWISETPGFFMQVSAGSVLNIKPELLLGDFFSFAGETFDPYAFERWRIEMYTGPKEQLVPLYRAE